MKSRLEDKEKFPTYFSYYYSLKYDFHFQLQYQIIFIATDRINIPSFFHLGQYFINIYTEENKCLKI
jgi:hypothetical protein